MEEIQTVTLNKINNILGNSEIEVFHKVFNKQCIAVAKLPNGFVLSGESAVVDPRKYDRQIGQEMAIDDIKHKLWELEGYLLQDKLDN
ncbi:MAG: hypothetical protein L0J75_01440 [Alkalibacterium sp.]|nr:hypothetical protein [Alkalibacterium sp.]